MFYNLSGQSYIVHFQSLYTSNFTYHKSHLVKNTSIKSLKNVGFLKLALSIGHN